MRRVGARSPGATASAVAVVLLVALWLIAPFAAHADPDGGARPAAASEAPTSGDFVTAVSEPTDDLGRGGALLWRFGSATMDLSGSPSGVVSLQVANGSADRYTFRFAAAPGKSLAAGTYVDAQYVESRTAGHPGIGIARAGGSCGGFSGRFTIYDIAPDLSRLHLTYEQRCADWSKPTYGEINIGASTQTAQLVAPDHIAWPDAHPGIPSRTVPVTVVNTGKSPTTVVSAVISAGSSDFQIADNGCTTLAPSETCSFGVRFTPSALGQRTGWATVSMSDGTSEVVALNGTGAPGHTSWAMHSQSGDGVGGGREWAFDTGTSAIYARGNPGQVEAVVVFPGADAFSEVRFNAVFSAAEGKQLQIGQRVRVSGHQGGDRSVPWMRVAGLGDCNTALGVFTVTQAEFAGGVLRKFAANFEQHCGDQTPGLFGSIAWRSDDPAAPVPTTMSGEAMGTTSQGGAPVSTGPLAAGSVATSVAVTGPYFTPVSIYTEDASFSGPRADYALFGKQVHIESTPGPDSFLTIAFTLDKKFDRPPVVFKDGVAVPACVSPNGPPDPAPSCIATAAEVNGDTVITVQTVSASVWNFAEPIGPNQSGQDITVLVPNSDPGGGAFTISVEGGGGAIQMGTPLTDNIDGVYFLSYSAPMDGLTVTDTRIGAQAWTVVGQMSNFDPALIFGRYMGWDPMIITPGMGAVAGPVIPSGYPGVGPGLHNTQILGSAPDGHEGGGATETTAVLGGTLNLHVPTAVPSGSYSGTLTLTALS